MHFVRDVRFSFAIKFFVRKWFETVWAIAISCKMIWVCLIPQNRVGFLPFDWFICLAFLAILLKFQFLNYFVKLFLKLFFWLKTTNFCEKISKCCPELTVTANDSKIKKNNFYWQKIVNFEWIVFVLLFHYFYW